MSNVNVHMFDAGVRRDPPFNGPALMRLPLNLIALIVSHLDDVGDLARLCRTCRVLNYMSLPQLYKNLTLTSYGRIRYNEDDLPEGYGSASPFSMGLNALVTRNMAPLVRSITLRGDWRDDGLEEHARVGRVPDSSMMLNISVRAAIDKMAGLESFSWQINNTKALEPVYQGLAQLQSLQSLTLRFPSSRHPRPTTTIPAMPNLRILKVTDIDPLCYPDDISLLLYGSKKLRDLRMHWSPRMRESQEPSVVLSDYFRRCIAAKAPLRIKKLAFQNFYALNTGEPGIGVDHGTLEEVTMLTSPTDNAAMTFVEASWPNPGPRDEMSNLKSFRIDRVEKRGLDFLQQLNPLESLYFVNPLREPVDYINNSRTGLSYPSSPSTPLPGGPGNFTTANDHGQQSQLTPPAQNQQSASSSASRVSLREMHVSTIISVHGATLKRLLLPARMNIPVPLVVRLVHACSNLEQLALAIDVNSLEVIGLVLPFLRKLEALRILIPTSQDSDLRSGTPSATSCTYRMGQYESKGNTTSSPESGNMPRPDLSILPPSDALDIATLVDIDDAYHAEALSMRLVEDIFKNIKVIGFGWKAWQVGGLYKVPVPGPSQPSPGNIPDSQAVTADFTADASNPSPNGDNAANLRGPVTTIGETYGPGTCNAQSWPKQPPQASNTPPGNRIPLGKRKYTDQNSSAPLHSPGGETYAPAEPKAKKQQHHAQSQPSSSASKVNPGFNTTPENYPERSFLSFMDEATIAQIPENLRKNLKDCYTEARGGASDEPFVWRRHVKRVGWDVLKHWEIWGLDVQEI
ncbi:hypothetical protein FQN49_002239 [Arthroderma sp. PD_2]|nr:hypothetical protein FQN49_002239 [Arthroderma sp. PD_2]